MARRVPKLLVPLMIVVAAIAMAMWAVLPSSAGQITPPVDTPTESVAPIPTMNPPRPPKPGSTFDPGPKDCPDCMAPSVD